ncbi:unnamed protein product [Allacma fusca]|uniref:Transposase Helix-turn-helix domain-containing protein n=1 Tax=Allacma fusca TaxID=39272 RepID=A0A8J2PS63_9HEXA|nr:unnamed protein product [Allacma fusca]
MGKFRKILPIILALRQVQTATTRKYWVHPIIKKRGEHVKLDRMYRDFPTKFFEYTRMSPPIFAKLLRLVDPYVRKKDTPYRDAIPPRIRLYVTLRYLATGDYIRTIATNFSLGKTTVWEILTECLPAVWIALKKDYVTLVVVVSVAYQPPSFRNDDASPALPDSNPNI